MSFFNVGAGRGYFWSGLANALGNIYTGTGREELLQEKYRLMQETQQKQHENMLERIQKEFGYKNELQKQKFDYDRELLKLKLSSEQAKTEQDYNNTKKGYIDLKNKVISDYASGILNKGKLDELIKEIDANIAYIDTKTGFNKFKEQIENTQNKPNPQTSKTIIDAINEKIKKY